MKIACGKNQSFSAVIPILVFMAGEYLITAILSFRVVRLNVVSVSAIALKTPKSRPNNKQPRVKQLNQINSMGF